MAQGRQDTRWASTGSLPVCLSHSIQRGYPSDSVLGELIYINDYMVPPSNVGIAAPKLGSLFRQEDECAPTFIIGRRQSTGIPKTEELSAEMDSLLGCVTHPGHQVLAGGCTTPVMSLSWSRSAGPGSYFPYQRQEQNLDYQG